ncbi:hypothetical protein CTheo_113 [Ceratobasidium theobromae]|uniref:Calcineurin-like phosphoesterase domain-containing protein n=1 Tax=Ceratobasidium theobromae TaxID=1582974 RepID=A0A5N5R100_9AGAM|nr:hypothetical protein CTheo_113 [Ceratobasidium theobromae]
MEPPHPTFSSPTYKVYTKPSLDSPIPRPGKGWTRFLCVSDTHRKPIPMVDGDILIHAGDFTTFTHGFKGALNWIKELRIPQKVLIAGNHEFNLDVKCRNKLYEKVPEILAVGTPKMELDEDRAMLTDSSAIEAGLTYLEAGSASIPSGAHSDKEWSTYGSPYTPEYGTMGFSYSRDQENCELLGSFARHKLRQPQAIWAPIPRDTEILVTHGPPLGILDISRHGRSHVGCPGLAHTVQHRLQHVRLHVFGHIHEGRGVEIHQGAMGQDIVFVNAACQHHKNPLPIVVDLRN